MSSEFSMSTLVTKTAGLSGSAIQELCRAAAMQPVREFIREHGQTLGGKKGDLDIEKLKAFGIEGIRPLETKDFQTAVVRSSVSSLEEPVE